MATIATSPSRARARRRRLPILSGLSALMVFAAAAIFLVELITFSQQDELMPAGISVGGVDVGGETQNSAIIKWQQVYEQPITLYYRDDPILLQPSAIGFRLNNETMLANALNARETSSNFWLRFFNYLTGQQLAQGANVELSAEFQQGLLVNYLEDIARRYDRLPGRPGYDVATLTVYEGERGSTLDIPAAAKLIEEALNKPTDRVVNLPTGDSAASRPNLKTLQQLIVDHLDSKGFIYDGQTSIASIFIMDLQTGEEINLLGDVAFTAASTAKVPILIDFYRFKDFPPDQDEAFIMANSLLCSLNSSSNLLLRLIGGGTEGAEFAGVADVTETAQAAGARNTFLSAPFVDGSANQQFGSVAVGETNPNANYITAADPYNQTTAEDMGTLFAQIYDCANYSSGLMTAFPEAFTQQECRQMLELMSANDLERLLQGGIPPEVRISHKNGWAGDMVGEAGVVYSPNGRNYVISVYLWKQTSEEFQNYEELWPLVEDISRAAWNYFNPDETLLTPRTDLPRTAQECAGNYLPPAGQVNLDDIWSWRQPAQ
jgi:beta-lactamase class A